MIRLIISHMAISKSICGNLNRRLKKRGILISLRREEGVVEPKWVHGVCARVVLSSRARVVAVV
jgi:hypothetical protein